MSVNLNFFQGQGTGEQVFIFTSSKLVSIFTSFKARERVHRCPSYQSPRSGRGLPGVGSRPLPVAKALGQSVTFMAGRHDGFTDQDVVLTEINSSRLRFRVGGGGGGNAVLSIIGPRTPAPGFCRPSTDFVRPEMTRGG